MLFLSRPSFSRALPRRSRPASPARSLFILAALLLCTVRPASALTIIPQFDSSITSDPNAATMEATINEVIRTYEAMLSDPFTVDVTFIENSSGLGESSTPYQSDTYTDFLAKLTADQTTSNDAIALAHLPVQTNNPVDGNPNMNTTVANAKALNIFTYGATGAGTIYLNTSLMNISRSGAQNASKYDMFAVAEHELDEVLGMSSSLQNGSNGQPAPTGAVNPIDLFRYDQSGNRSYTTSSNALAYLSIDGTTDLVQFNQISNSTNSGDFGDYNSFTGPSTPRVQDAYGTPGVILNIGVAEKTSLDVIGYNLLTPLTWDATATSGTNPIDGGGTWANGAGGNWSNGAADAPWTNSSTATAQFGGASFISGTAYSVSLGTNIVVGTLTFANQAYTLTGANSLTVNNAIISVSNATINVPTILSGDNGWDTVGSAQLTEHGNVSGPYSLTKQGPGSLYLTGSDSYAGGTIVQEGTLLVGSSNALPAGSNVTVSGGAMDLNGDNVSIGNLTFGDGVSTIAAAFQDSATTRGAASLAGNITYNGTLVNGATYFPAATLSANLSLLTGTHSITSPDNYIANNYDLAVTGTLSGPGGIAKNGVNYVALAAANTYTGSTTVNSGWLFLAATDAIPPMSDVTVNNGGVLSLNPANAQTGVTTGNYDQSVGSLSGNGQINLGSATLTFGNNNATTTFSGYIMGTGGLTKTGTGAFILPTGLSYTGATTINSGTFELSNGGSVAGIITGSSGAYLAVVGSSTTVLSNTITGGIGLQQAQAGYLYVTGDNTYSGGTFITGQALVLGNNTTTGSLGTGNVYDTAGLYLLHSNNFTLPNAVAGTGFLVQENAVTVTLTGSNSYTGATQIAAGAIQIGNGGTTGSISGSTPVNGNSGATLIFDRSDNIAFGNSTSGGMGLTQSGSGSLTLTAVNGYTGPTTVTSGTLIVNGGITGSTTTVNSGGAVAGIGTLGPLSIQSGGIVTPGPGAGGVGFLTAGNFSLAVGATLMIQLDGTSGGGTSGTQYDQLSVGGSVTLGGNIQISLSNFTPAVGETFYGILNDGADAVSGAFADVTGNILISNGWKYSVNYAANGDNGSVGNDVSFTVLAAVPEPAPSFMLLGASALLAVVRTRKSQKAA